MSYVVTWSIEIDEESAYNDEDAARQGWEIIVDSACGDGIATVVVVRDENDKHLGTFDMEGGKCRRVNR
jgi:hypothetical protein